tara:strand:+ start:8901 stop:10097 length:1197 start_codon:yes stop_codon:yes gene_type:complete
MNIYSLSISNKGLNPNGETRKFKVGADIGASAIIQVVSSSGTFYNFKTKTFSSEFNNETKIEHTFISSIYENFIKFPAATQNYNVIVLPDPKTDTILSEKVLNTEIEQVSNTVLTFSLTTDNSSTYKTFPTSVTSTATPSSTEKRTVNFDYTVENVETDANGFGLRLTAQPTEKEVFTDITAVIAENPRGDGVSSFKINVTDTTGLVVGSTLIFTKGTTAATAGVTITNIKGQSVTFSGSEEFEDGETITVRARGSKAIKKALGLNNIAFNFGTASDTKITKTVRADGSVADEATDGSNAKIAVDGTYGLSGGSHVTFTGVGVDNSSTNNINVVTASSSAGLFTCDVAQSLTAGTVLTFKGSSRFVNIPGNITITGSPRVNSTIKLDLDKFITPGTAS